MSLHNEGRAPMTPRKAVLDGTTELHTVLPVDVADLPGPYPQIDRAKAQEHGLYSGYSEGLTPEPYLIAVLVTGDRLTFVDEAKA